MINIPVYCFMKCGRRVNDVQQGQYRHPYAYRNRCLLEGYSLKMLGDKLLKE